MSYREERTVHVRCDVCGDCADAPCLPATWTVIRGALDAVTCSAACLREVAWRMIGTSRADADALRAAIASRDAAVRSAAEEAAHLLMRGASEAEIRRHFLARVPERWLPS